MKNLSKPVLNYRRKTLLGLLRVFGGRLPRLDFQKYLFLFTQEFQREPSFEFVPYKFGCFSFQSYADKRRLIEIGALVDSDNWQLVDEFEFGKLPEDCEFEKLYKKYSPLKGDRLVQDIYRRYPYYAINSEIASRLMTRNELERIETARPGGNATRFFTIGYEGSSFEGYLNRLIQNNICTLVDVRRNPLSRKYGFSKKTLSDTVEKLGIEYVHMPELGISSEHRQELNTQADYDRLFASYEKRELKKNETSLERLATIVQKRKRVAITCFEEQVCKCHRGRIANSLMQHPKWRCEITHI